MFDSIIAARRKDSGKDSGSSDFISKNKTALALVLILVVVAVFVAQPKGVVQGPSTPIESKISTQSEAGETISDLSSSAAAVSSFLKDIDNSIG
ncbi:MAG TPA: hypothetical protein VI933_04565 [archaeon]|nr:hypothetical protein [archaeon]